MSSNLVDLLVRAVTPDLMSSLGKVVGASDSSVTSAIGSLIPALLGGMAQKASSGEGASSLFSLLNGSNVDSGIAGTLGSLLGSGNTSALTQVGTTLLSSLFGGNRVDGLGQALGATSGMAGGSAKNLLLMVAPLAFGVLKKFIVGNRLDAPAVANLLRDQAPHLAGKLDSRLTTALGLGSPESLVAGLGQRVTAAAGAVGATATAAAGHAAHAATAATTAAATTAAAGASGIGRFLPWLIGGALALFLLSQLGNCSGTPKVAAPVAVAPAPAVVAPAPAPVVAAPAVEVAALPAKVYFDTGKFDVGSKGTESVAAVAAWMKADAARKIAITGYTDKAGDTASNEKLAKDRALAVRAALEAAGVTQDRIEMKPPYFVEAGTGGAEAEARRVEITAN